MKKILGLFLTIVLSLGVLAGCGSSNSAGQTSSNKKQVVKIGITGDDHVIWDKVKQNLAKENIDLQIVSFADYVRPNLALSDGEIDLNSFQHYAYLNKFKSEHKLKISAIGETVLAPLGVYSSKIKSVKDIKEGAKIAIPNDATNEGRGLNLLQSAGLIKLKDGVGLLPKLQDVTENPKNIQFVELVATQIPRSLQDVDAAIINSGVAIDAKLNPVKDSIYLEDVSSKNAKPYINVIVAKDKDKNNATYKKVVKAYQTDEIKKLIKDTYKGSEIPVF
ncbi:MetQ/NlpA family ABC transporter substrate-binding protein [Clostridium luticellarii]|jgi:D-methionine transport system substrate-binding protein|uniref:Lipoprotein n=1 Tax=Clostridium luticellarii TaxID=1691940 RepID=A0A2T0BNX8_9CLOT|nr:MetQ/NlpA family ABC transporter substrate-binding protein [Clostridium luticellarii]MCI1945076.1 MetQ/NlpA family ABC transporter substrate-binding protein [Clostridium luticellarii]MCI1968569.1 MetQ/NlpA family ABC transporter substrate-binding protein [Clostridium luticellarii]PRR85589.1 D-methionine-binding lipoprotein MetQ precursor [Clostridium luticellarii]